MALSARLAHFTPNEQQHLLIGFLTTKYPELVGLDDVVQVLAHGRRAGPFEVSRAEADIILRQLVAKGVAERAPELPVRYRLAERALEFGHEIREEILREQKATHSKQA